MLNRVIMNVEQNILKYFNKKALKRLKSIEMGIGSF